MDTLSTRPAAPPLAVGAAIGADRLRWRTALCSVFVAVLAACGGGGGGAADAPSTPEANGSEPVAATPVAASDAARFLTQATFGPTQADIDRVVRIGYAAWIDEQLRKPASASHRARWEAADAAQKAIDPGRSAWQEELSYSFWQSALTGDDQLRQRVAFALSQIFVISMQGSSVGENPRAVAAYYDMLGTTGLSTYRQLLEAVTLHPMMGTYLSHLRNQKADPVTGRVPDENYAREVMQLFSIGLQQLNRDGTPKLVGGQPVDTYGPSDIAGLAKVFTGFSFACPDWPDSNCFRWGMKGTSSDLDRHFKPMVGYPQFHAKEEKTFLGVTIPAQTTADPTASLRVALDTIANHPNVGPFIGRQLIQRLVSSNPSPAYVAAVAAVFDDNGSGVRGDMKAVVKAVLMHPEARIVTQRSGKVREPVLRLSAFLRAFRFTSDSGEWRLGNTDNPGTSLGQSAMRAPSVFNFWRPGYVPPGTQSAQAGLSVPELQLVHETTSAGYVNFMRDAVSQGIGAWAGTVGTRVLNRRDLQPDFSAELALVDQPAALVERLNQKLTYGQMPAGLKTEIQSAVESIVIPGLNAAGTNQSAIDNARRNRAHAAILLTLASPEFAVQK